MIRVNSAAKPHQIVIILVIFLVNVVVIVLLKLRGRCRVLWSLRILSTSPSSTIGSSCLVSVRIWVLPSTKTMASSLENRSLVRVISMLSSISTVVVVCLIGLQ